MGKKKKKKRIKKLFPEIEEHRKKNPGCLFICKVILTASVFQDMLRPVHGLNYSLTVIEGY